MQQKQRWYESKWDWIWVQRARRWHKGASALKISPALPLLLGRGKLVHPPFRGGSNNSTEPCSLLEMEHLCNDIGELLA